MPSHQYLLQLRNIIAGRCRLHKRRKAKEAGWCAECIRKRRAREGRKGRRIQRRGPLPASNAEAQAAAREKLAEYMRQMAEPEAGPKYKKVITRQIWPQPQEDAK